MTHDDLYPCTNCGRDNLYPGPCASCEHSIHPPAKPTPIDDLVRDWEPGKYTMIAGRSKPPRVACYDCRKPCNGTCPASRGEPTEGA